ncbi:TadE/TadG family type IV pilus assembly protein [Actinobacillus equuli]|uniref:TadE/TadG family type IV pilus assembly protein n=1 Tax=Actinobacillus equuli TaxID=718 RepID=UPI002441DC41|nr:pilus assembly protein [Actinobacillus equuli]WGE59746.1 pilus assembly protein [Actinobacillus equuli subsp. haemolyticus]
MKNTLSRFIRNVKGVATIEFSLTIGLFILVLFMIAEGCRITLLSSYLDLSVSEASRVTGKQEIGSNYQEIFEKNLKQKDSLWTFLNQDSITSIEVKYARNLDDLVQQKFQTSASGAAFAQYAFNYNYKPLFFRVPSAAVEPIFRRNIVVLQEYEKDKAISN